MPTADRFSICHQNAVNFKKARYIGHGLLKRQLNLWLSSAKCIRLLSPWHQIAQLKSEYKQSLSRTFYSWDSLFSCYVRQTRGHVTNSKITLASRSVFEYVDVARMYTMTASHSNPSNDCTFVQFKPNYSTRFSPSGRRTLACKNLPSAVTRIAALKISDTVLFLPSRKSNRSHSRNPPQHYPWYRIRQLVKIVHITTWFLHCILWSIT